MNSASSQSEFVIARESETAKRVAVRRRINFDQSEKAPKLSVIVPVCNVETYVGECLESIAAQTMSDFEAICVNDGSTDNSLQFLLEMAERDKRFKVIDKENAGYGHAMNIGFDSARGDFIAIVESDDYIRPKMFETLVGTAEQYDLDFVKSDFYRFTNEPDATRLFYNAIGQKKEQYNRVFDPIESLDFFRFSNTWCGVYRKAFLDKYAICHQETPGASYQDNGFWFQTTVAATRVMYLETPFYMNRRDNPNSSVHNTRKLYAGNSEYAFCEKFLKRHPDLYEKYIGHLVKKKLDTYSYNFKRVTPELKKEYLDYCSSELAVAFAEKQVNKELFSKSDFEKLKTIATDPESFYDKHRHEKLATFTGDVSSNAIPVVFITDNDYALAATVAISSLIASKARDTRYHVTVVGVGLTDQNVKALTSLKTGLVAIEILQLDLEKAREIASGGTDLTNYGVPPTALVKFMLPSLLENQKKVIYLDDDVLVAKDLTGLYKENLAGNTIGAVPDMPQVLYKTQSFGQEYGRDYFNSGMLLLDLEAMRKKNHQDLLVKTKRSLESSLQDQDVFNEVYKEDRVVLPVKYNTLIVNLYRSKKRFDINQINRKCNTSYTGLEDVRRDSVVMHFCSSDKPWKRYDVPMADRWLFEYSNTSFGDLNLKRNSVVGKVQEVVSNGFYDIREEDNRVHVAIYVTKTNFLMAREFVRSLSRVSSAKQDENVLHVFYTSLNEEEVDQVLDLAVSGCAVEVHNIKRSIERDSEYVRHPIPSGYFKMLVAEVLYDLDAVLILDGAKIVSEIDELIRDFTFDTISALIAPQLSGSVRFFDSPAILIDPKAFVRANVKGRYFDNLRRTSRSKRSPVSSMKFALRALRFGELRSSCIDCTEKLMSSAYSDLADRINSKSGIARSAKPTHAAMESGGFAYSSEMERKYFLEGVEHTRKSKSYRIGNKIVNGGKRILKPINNLRNAFKR